MKEIKGHLPGDPGALQDSESGKPDQGHRSSDWKGSGGGKGSRQSQKPASKCPLSTVGSAFTHCLGSWARHRTPLLAPGEKESSGCCSLGGALALHSHRLRGGPVSRLSSTGVLWRRSWRGLDLWLTWEVDARAGPWRSQVPPSFPDPGIKFCPQLKPFSRMQPWESNRLLRPSGLYRGWTPVKVFL